MTDSNVNLGRATDMNSFDIPAIKAKNLGDGTYALAVSVESLATLLTNQQTIITRLTAIETLLTNGIGVNVLSGGL